MNVLAIITEVDNMYVVNCPEVDVVAQGDTVEEAIENAKDIIEAFVKEFGEPKCKDIFIARFHLGN